MRLEAGRPSRWCAALALTAACGTPPPTVASPDKTHSEPSTDPAPAKREDPVVAKTPSPAVAPPVHRKPNPEGFGDACGSEEECVWDDACLPRACVGVEYAPSDDIVCDESGPPPGACLCVAGRCALRPSSPPAAAPGNCRVDQCGLDEASARCSVGEALQANRFPRDEGPLCRCDADRGCEFAWVEPVACTSASDCWISGDVPWHPIARPKQLRAKSFRPCKDGELAPTCADGRCTLTAYSC